MYEVLNNPIKNTLQDNVNIFKLGVNLIKKYSYAEKKTD